MADQEREDLDRAFERHLTERERKVLYLRFGLDDGEPRTFPEIASLLGISADDVEAIANGALRKLEAEEGSRFLSLLRSNASRDLLIMDVDLNDPVFRDVRSHVADMQIIDLASGEYGVIEIKHYRRAESSGRGLRLTIDPGEATAEDLAEFYSALSDLYRAYGGKGLVFRSNSEVGLTVGAA